MPTTRFERVIFAYKSYKPVFSADTSATLYHLAKMAFNGRGQAQKLYNLWMRWFEMVSQEGRIPPFLEFFRGCSFSDRRGV